MTDPLDDLLRSEARVADGDLRSPRVLDGMDALWLEAKGEEKAASSAVPSRRSKVRRRVTGAVAALVVVGLGVGVAPAFADWVSLRTGTYDTGSQSDPQPTSSEREWLRLDSAELGPQLRAWESDYPLAPGYSLDPLVDGYAGVERSQATAGMMHDDVFFFSECTWVDYWLTADRAGDAAAKREATTGLADTIANLDTVATLDQHGRPSMIALATAAKNDHRALLENERQLNCDWNFR